MYHPPMKVSTGPGRKIIPVKWFLSTKNRSSPKFRHSSTYFHRRVTHLTALRVLRLGAWSAVMPVHHKGRATTSEEPARPPAGSLFAATGGRRRRLTMSRHRRRAASYPAAAKRRSYVLPSYESKYSARAAWRCLRIGKGAQRRHGAKEPGHRSRQNGFSDASRRLPDVPHRAARSRDIDLASA